MKGRLTSAIDNAYNAEPESDYRSSRIGASIIGNPCEAALAFALRGFPDSEHPAFLKRIFRDGHTLEKTVLKDLKKAGYVIEEIDPMTGKQYMWDYNGGHMVFYADGIITMDGSPQLLEIKSMNDAMWKKFQEHGVRVSHPKYYSQLQMGMGLSGFKSATIIGYNKNTSRYWDETVEFDEIEYSALLERAERVLRGDAKKVATDETDWRCRDCSKSAVCWGTAPVIEDRRTCAHSYPVKGGWSCSKGCVDKCMFYERYRPRERI